MIVPPASAVAPDRVALSAIAWPALTVWLAVVTIAVVFLTTVKHSVVAFVCDAARYCEAAFGTYSARKQYLPTAAGVYAAEVAVPPLALVVTATPPAAPTWVPPVGQPLPVEEAQRDEARHRPGDQVL